MGYALNKSERLAGLCYQYGRLLDEIAELKEFKDFDPEYHGIILAGKKIALEELEKQIEEMKS